MAHDRPTRGNPQAVGDPAGDDPELVARTLLLEEALALGHFARGRLGEAGRRDVAEHHSVGATASVCDRAFRAALQRPSTIRAGTEPVRQTGGGPAR